MIRIDEINREVREDFKGFFRGIVVDNDDPLKAGRVKVRVFPFFDGVFKEDLPWAIYADPLMGGIANTGSIMVPEIDSHVFVFFENADFRYPVYFAGAPAIENNSPDVPTLSREDDGTVAEDNTNARKSVPTADNGTWDEPDNSHQTGYPHNRVIRTKSGILIELDDTPSNERIHIRHPSGTREEIHVSGDKIEHVVNDSYKVVHGNDNMLVEGNVNITVNGTTNLKSTVVNVDCADINFDNNNNPAGVVTVNHVCAFTGNPHPQGSTTVKSGG